MKAILQGGLLALAIMALAVPANAGQFEDGLVAYQRGDYSTALQVWQPLAEQGDAQAQNNLGLIYDRGQGVRQNYATARKWYRKAADQGLADAQFNLGVLYANAQGVKRDYVIAHRWFILAAASGDEEARQLLPVQANEMPPAQVAEAQRLAREWKKKQQQ